MYSIQKLVQPKQVQCLVYQLYLIMTDSRVSVSSVVKGAW